MEGLEKISPKEESVEVPRFSLTREALVKQAEHDVVDRYKQEIGKWQELFKKDPVYELKGRTYPVVNEAGYMIGEVQTRLTSSEKTLEDAVARHDYQVEKIAAKLVAFYENKLELLKSYAEAKLNYPEFAKALEEENPFLVEMHIDAKKALTHLN